MSLATLLNYRRAVRRYSKSEFIDPEVVKKCLELAQLAPTSSNLQLWEAYHITRPDYLSQMAEACLNQGAACSAQEMVVFVTRQDLHIQREKILYEFGVSEIKKTSPQEKRDSRIAKTKEYYQRLMPFFYSRCFGLLGLVRKIIVEIRGLFKPTPRECSESDVQVVVHKSCALAIQTFMLAMAEQKYDTCPLEGFDSRMIKKILKLPRGAEVCMVITCGIRSEEGIRGERFRIPFEQQYTRL